VSSLPHWIKTFGPAICPECKKIMMFVRVSNEQPGFKQRTFKCPECGHAETDIVKVGPIFKTRDFG
jgi:hypothetical protein